MAEWPFTAFFLIGLACITTAFLPNVPVRWKSRGSRRKGPIMSAAGRGLFGLFFLNLGSATLLSRAARPIIVTLGFIIFAGIVIVFVRDYENAPPP